ncbi:MAG: RidA family protein [Bacteroidota bacterium]
MSATSRIQELGLSLPPSPPPGGIYKPVLVHDHLLYVSGTVPVQSDGSFITGRVGVDLSVEEGFAAARQVGLTMLSVIQTHFGDLDAIKRLVKTYGMVNSAMDFYDHPKVINGFSQLMQEVFGEDQGTGVRSAIGMMLPVNCAVEIEAIFALKKSEDYAY